jgi:transcriptional regulator with XRE-family HTH domain
MTTTPDRRSATLTELVAQEIDAVRGRRRMSQAQLARAMGKTPMWVSLRLRGRQPIDMNDLLKFARALDVGVHQLLPSPEVVAGATDESATVAYLALTSRFAEHTTRPRDNRPISGPPRSSPSDTIRTGYLSRTARRKRA